LADKGPDDHVILVPAAPFSIAVYEAAAHKELSQIADPPRLSCIKPWGAAPDLIAAYVEGVLGAIGERSEGTHVILSAHSLPQVVIDAGDLYAEQFTNTCELVTEGIQNGLAEQGRAQLKVHACYQSQGAMQGDWLGPDLESTMLAAKTDGAQRLVVSPIGFLTEHIETLYDLDVEAAQRAKSWGMAWQRVPALGSHPGLIAAMAQAASDVGKGTFSASGSSR
jgi:ferrochelatase